MTTTYGQMTRQMTNPWPSARRPNLVTRGHLATCLFITTYRAKYYLTNLWSSAWPSDPLSWPPARPHRGRWPDGHTRRERGHLAAPKAAHAPARWWRAAA